MERIGISQRFRSERGAQFVEYVLLAMLLAIGMMAAMGTIGSSLRSSFFDSTGQLFGSVSS
ncbi:MAG: Flp family type IVb pilin [Oligoflexia bacterium]|nr:Flp family type IVb pilin [Oligoflexia bacterium]